MKILAHAFLLLSFPFALVAEVSARQEPVRETSVVRADFIEALRKLQVFGVQRVAGRDITQLLSDGERILLQFQEKVRWQGADGGIREAARWKKNTAPTEGAPLGQITASQSLLLADAPIRAPVSQHEHFGPLDIDDDNSHLSALITTYISLEEWSRTRPHEVYIASNIRAMMREMIERGGGGGSTGVEGGGGLYLEFFMVLVQKDLFQRVNSDLITESEYRRVLKYIKTLKIVVSDKVPLWEPLFERCTKTAMIPRHEIRVEDLSTFDANQQVVGLVNQWLEAMYVENSAGCSPSQGLSSSDHAAPNPIQPDTLRDE
jgi:hypothetical protein